MVCDITFHMFFANQDVSCITMLYFSLNW